MGFWLFLLLNAVLLLRPEDLSPSLEGTRLYLFLSIACLIVSAPSIVSQFTPQALGDRPMTVCVLGYLAAIVLSLMVRMLFARAADEGAEFAKIVAYFLLFVAVVDSPERIRQFLGWTVGLVSATVVLGLMQFHGQIDVKALRPVEQAVYDEHTGELAGQFERLRSAGIFHDPNDLCLILTMASLAAIARAATSASALGVLWLAPIGLFGYALMLTQSRGGLIGLAAGLATLAVVRLGLRRGLPLALAAIVALGVVFGGRQTDIRLDEADTAQGRLRLWAEGLSLMWRNPITGIGANEYVEEVGLQAHNSFIHAYVETGLVGGTLFAGAFFLAVSGMWRLPRYGEFWSHEHEFTALRPFILAMVVAYAAGVFSLSRNYTATTYMVLGLAAAYMRVALPNPPDEYRLTARQAMTLLLAGFGFFVFLKFFTQTLVRFG
jgi:hypothetical protein